MRRFLPLFALLFAACTAPSGADEDLVVVEDGKADNYYSSIATEYALSGSVPVAIEDFDYMTPATRQSKIQERLTAVGVYLTAYLSDKFQSEDVNYDGKITSDEVFYQNEGYGGFDAMVRNATIADSDITKVGAGKYSVKFSVNVAGPKNLSTRIPHAAGSAGRFAFDLKMPAGATRDPASVDDSAIRHFDAATYKEPMDTIRLSAQILPKPGNAYPNYAAFFADGTYDMTLIFGYDYNTPRGDILEAKEAYDLLVKGGFTSPVTAFAGLGRDSGPLVKTTTAGGKPLRIEVRILHTDMFTENRSLERDVVLEELKTRDVLVYRGHSGPYYGFSLAPNGSGQIDYLEIPRLMLSDKQQLFIAQGCQTYSQYADMFYANPAKNVANLDVITTVNFSNSTATTMLVEPLLKIDAPVDYYTLIHSLNDAQLNYDQHVFYGVMGIDENPTLHPYARLDQIGLTCAAASDCGDATGNVCVDKVCGARSLDASGCPTGTRFRQLASASTKTIKDSACF